MDQMKICYGEEGINFLYNIRNSVQKLNLSNKIFWQASKWNSST